MLLGQVTVSWVGGVGHGSKSCGTNTCCCSDKGVALAKAGGWHKALVLSCLPLAAPIGLSPLLILTFCGSERVLVVSTEPPDDLSWLTGPGSAVPETGCCPCRCQVGGGIHWLRKSWGGAWEMAMGPCGMAVVVQEGGRRWSTGRQPRAVVVLVRLQRGTGTGHFSREGRAAPTHCLRRGFPHCMPRNCLTRDIATWRNAAAGLHKLGWAHRSLVRPVHIP